MRRAPTSLARQRKPRKSLPAEIFDSATVAMTIANWLAFVPTILVYYAVANQIAEEMGCTSFNDVLTGDAECGEMLKIGVIDSGAVWAEGGVFALVTTLSGTFGTLLGICRWLVNVYSPDLRSIPIVNISVVNGSRQISTRLTQRPLSERLIPAGELNSQSEEGDQPNREDLIQRLNKISRNAWRASRVALLPAAILGLPQMYAAGSKILKEFGCDEAYLKVIFFGAKDTEQCGPIAIYYGMTAFAWPWMWLTWGSYFILVLTVTLQLLPTVILRFLSLPLQCLLWPLYQCVAAVSYCLRGREQFFQDLKQHIALWVQAVALLIFYVSLIPVLRDGIQFSNAVLNQLGCPDDFFTTLFSLYSTHPEACPPLTRTLGIDAFPTKSEIFDTYVLAILALVTGSLLGIVVGSLWLNLTRDVVALRVLIETCLKFIDQVIAVGKYSSLFFIFPSAYMLFGVAIPGANVQLQKNAGCENAYYPNFVYDLYDSECPILPRYGALASAVSKSWIMFIDSMVISFAVGSLGYIVGKSAVALTARLPESTRQNCCLFRPVSDAASVHTEADQSQDEVFLSLGDPGL